jgi:integrase
VLTSRPVSINANPLGCAVGASDLCPKVAIDAWATTAVIADGFVFRPVNRGDRVSGGGVSEKIIWQLLRPYAAAVGVAGIAPHDMKRTCAKLCRAAGGELEQIQLLLDGHSSVQTTERYLGTKQDLAGVYKISRSFWASPS